MSNKNRVCAWRTVRVVTKKKRKWWDSLASSPKASQNAVQVWHYIQAYILDAHKLNWVCTAGQFEGSWLLTLGSNQLSSTSAGLRISKELSLHFSDLCSFGRDEFVLLRHSGLSADGTAGWTPRGHHVVKTWQILSISSLVNHDFSTFYIHKGQHGQEGIRPIGWLLPENPFMMA